MKQLINDPCEFKITGFVPGAIGRIIELHGHYYGNEWGFSVVFEAEIAAELAEFMLHFNPQRDGLWLAHAQNTIIGAIAIDGRKAKQEGARLRWFIVDPDWRGYGIGQRLLQDAIAFCRARAFSQVYLWTFEGLLGARSLYDRAGFVLVESVISQHWKTPITKQKFQLTLASSPAVDQR